MAVTHEELPRDENGILQGVWRVLHRERNYHGPLGNVHVEHGVGQTPVWGRLLSVVVAFYGPDIYLEPWTGPVPDGFVLGPLTAWSVPGYKPEPCPWRAGASLPETLPPPPPEPEPAPIVAPDPDPEPEPEADPLTSVSDEDLEALTLEELQALATQLVPDMDGRWRERRLIREIRAARG